MSFSSCGSLFTLGHARDFLERPLDFPADPAGRQLHKPGQNVGKEGLEPKPGLRVCMQRVLCHVLLTSGRIRLDHDLS